MHWLRALDEFSRRRLTKDWTEANAYFSGYNLEERAWLCQQKENALAFCS